MDTLPSTKSKESSPLSRLKFTFLKKGCVSNSVHLSVYSPVFLQTAIKSFRIIIFVFTALFLSDLGFSDVSAQNTPAFGCEMRPGYRICTAGGCTEAPAQCYPTSMGSACPDDLANGICYAVENQDTCQQFGASGCSSAGPFACVAVPCDPSPAPTFSCDWLAVDGTPRCLADIGGNVCPDDPANGICYENDNAACSGQNQQQCLSGDSRACVRVACNASVQPPASTPTPTLEPGLPHGSPTPTLEPGLPRVTPITPQTFSCAWTQIDQLRGVCAPAASSCPRNGDACFRASPSLCAVYNTETECNNASQLQCRRVVCATPPDYSAPYSSGLRWPPQTVPPGYNAPDYPEDDVQEHIATEGERAIPFPYLFCSQTSGQEFHSLRPYQASPCFNDVGDIAIMCANTLTLQGQYSFSPSDCQCSCGGCTCSAGGTASGCTCHCDCSKHFELNTIVDVFDAELPIMGNTEDKIVNSQDQDLPEGIDHFAKVNEYVSWYLSGVNQRAEYGDPYLENPATTNYIVDFAGPIKKLLSWDNMAYERNQQIDRAGNSGRASFDVGGRHNQIVACQSTPGVASACYTEGGQRLRISNWNGDEAPLLSDFDNPEDYREALAEWNEDPENRLFKFIPLSSTEDRLGYLGMPDGAYTISVTGGSVTGQSVTVDPSELYYPHLEEGRELTDLLQRTYLSKDFIVDDRNGDGVPDIDVSKTKHVIPANPPSCDLMRVRTNPGDTLNPTELNVTASFTVSTSCEVPGQSACDCDEDPETGAEDCVCVCIAAGATCPGGTVNVTVDLNNYMPLAQENFNRTVGSPESPLQRIFPKIESDSPIEGIYDMPGYSLVNFESQGALTLVDVENPGGFPLPPKLFYPHIGSIHQYFLNCIQTAMRPQGYGPYCEQGELNNEDAIAENPPVDPANPYRTPENTTPRNNPVPVPTPDPNLDPPPGITPVPPRPAQNNCVPLNYTLDFHPGVEVASNTAVPTWEGYRSLPNLDCVSESDYNRVVAAARAAGFNPNFILAIWAEESWAGCYQGVAQMGCITISFSLTSQLNCILGLYDGLYSSSQYDACRAGDQPTFEEFMLYFSEGSCRSVIDHNYLFCTNRNFPNNFYTRYQQIMSAFD